MTEAHEERSESQQLQGSKNFFTFARYNRSISSDRKILLNPFYIDAVKLSVSVRLKGKYGAKHVAKADTNIFTSPYIGRVAGFLISASDHRKKTALTFY